jgi:predicted alpha/beta-hydrolase family hydrolase
MYSFLSDLVPGSTRRKELGQRVTISGTISLLTIEYEHVIIKQLQHAVQPFGNNTITITFNDNKCQGLAIQ